MVQSKVLTATHFLNIFYTVIKAKCNLLERLFSYMIMFISHHSCPVPVCTYLPQFRGQ